MNCRRCGKAGAAHSWKACALGGSFKLCDDCDVAANDALLRLVAPTERDRLIDDYRRAAQVTAEYQAAGF